MGLHWLRINEDVLIYSLTQTPESWTRGRRHSSIVIDRRHSSIFKLLKGSRGILLLHPEEEKQWHLRFASWCQVEVNSPKDAHHHRGHWSCQLPRKITAAGLSLFAAAATAKSLLLCPTLCDPIDGSPPGSPVPGILWARTLEWVAISFSNAWKWKVKVKSLSRVQL